MFPGIYSFHTVSHTDAWDFICKSGLECFAFEHVTTFFFSWCTLTSSARNLLTLLYDADVTQSSSGIGNHNNVFYAFGKTSCVYGKARQVTRKLSMCRLCFEMISFSVLLFIIVYAMHKYVAQTQGFCKCSLALICICTCCKYLFIHKLGYWWCHGIFQWVVKFLLFHLAYY